MSQNYLWKQPKLQDILSLYLPEKIENTLLNWPLDMKLEPISELVKVDNHLAHKMYDLRFCLPLFSYLLSPGAFVHCTQLIQSKVLMLIFISLSSLEAPVRALGYYCLTQFYQHLEGSNFREKGIWLCLLDSLCNSIVSTNPKIPNIITLFLARTVDIFTKPEHKLYRPLYAFILRKPCLDIAQVPEFYNLFNSTYIEHRIHRQWLLNLLADGLRSSLDFHICEKRYIFSTLLLHYTSCLSTSQERVSILQTVNSAGKKFESSARTLCQKALLTWLHNSIEECDWSHTEILKHICEIMKNLEVNVPDNFHFTVILWSLIAKIKVKFLDIGSIKTLLSALLKSLTTMKNSDNSLWSNIKLSEENVEDLYKLWKSLVEKLESKQEMNTEEGKDLTEVLNIKETFLILAKIMIFWEPLLGENVPESIYNKQIKYFNNILELILKNNENSLFYSKELPLWLYKCMGIDSRNGLIKMFLSSEGVKNLTSIIRLFEKDFSVKEEFKDNCLNWKNILLYMNDTLMNSNITSCSMMFQQICDAVR
ncbi:nucleolar pre-ribosomal-associated protein 1 [Caerostris extrusa]|uniref:Nucleolar pre-ribosomal-associated protein 1 n=1 Tax=Caerostris extrusa TaxID=172846 RepID=A0AAV4SB19_CAEEX|nr:nucleolar pre-ribosomal-associated protein 1 [Caerostris extrusa]